MQFLQLRVPLQSFLSALCCSDKCSSIYLSEFPLFGQGQGRRLPLARALRTFLGPVARRASLLGSQSERFTGNMRKLVSTITTLSSFLNVSIQEQGDVHVRCAAVLRALPNYLHEDDSTFLRLWHVEQSDDPDIDDVAVELLLISARSTNATLFCPERIAVVLEGNRVIELPTLADAFILLFALIFTLYLSYPKDLANTLDFTQNVLMGLDEGNLRPRVLSLKNDLLAV
ncbi:hypothetical protein NQZ68_000874 [Dissostichus eleginoides]|nr:hypothetical protein NQZ68_000874 [Dissostichus eleginoides]